MTQPKEGGSEATPELQRWLEKYYLVDGRPPDFTAMDALEATEHALRKWEGLTALEGTGLFYGLFALQYSDPAREQEYFSFNTETCALCMKYINPDVEDFEDECPECPLAQTLGRTCDEEDNSLYLASMHNPQPMINALRTTRNRLLG